MFGSFFRTAEVDQLADWILGEIKQLLPPGFDPDTKKIADRAQKLKDRIAKRAVEFKKTGGLNIYKKARLASRVRDGMSAQGYPEAFVKSFSYDLITMIEYGSRQKTT